MYKCDLQRIRESRNISQAELARKVGVSQVAISHIERGRQWPSIPIALRLSDTLGCTLDELFARKVD